MALQSAISLINQHQQPSAQEPFFRMIIVDCNPKRVTMSLTVLACLHPGNIVCFCRLACTPRSIMLLRYHLA